VRGTNSTTGKPLSGLDHLRQSIRDILTTPLGSRVMLRDYGSRLFDLVDAPINRQTIVDIYAATVEALAKWEPRIAVSRVFATSVQPGQITLSLEGTYLPNGQPVVMDGLVI